MGTNGNPSNLPPAVSTESREDMTWRIPKQLLCNNLKVKVLFCNLSSIQKSLCPVGNECYTKETSYSKLLREYSLKHIKCWVLLTNNNFHSTNLCWKELCTKHCPRQHVSDKEIPLHTGCLDKLWVLTKIGKKTREE